eukprot:9283479-Pyramimonas_sp.AAC.2
MLLSECVLCLGRLASTAASIEYSTVQYRRRRRGRRMMVTMWRVRERTGMKVRGGEGMRGFCHGSEMKRHAVVVLRCVDCATAAAADPGFI